MSTVREKIINALTLFYASIKSKFVLVGNVVNNCASTSTTYPLAANQGTQLQNQIDELNTNITNYVPLTGNANISGYKTFTGRLQIGDSNHFLYHDNGQIWVQDTAANDTVLTWYPLIYAKTSLQKSTGIIRRRISIGSISIAASGKYSTNISIAYSGYTALIGKIVATGSPYVYSYYDEVLESDNTKFSLSLYNTKTSAISVSPVIEVLYRQN